MNKINGILPTSKKDIDRNYDECETMWNYVEHESNWKQTRPTIENPIPFNSI